MKKGTNRIIEMYNKKTRFAIHIHQKNWDGENDEFVIDNHKMEEMQKR